MIPLRDNIPSSRAPVVTVSLIALNGLVFVHELMLGARVDPFVRAWGLVPARLFSDGDVWTLATSMFLHGGWAHIIGNMLYLWIFGDNVEDRLGRGRFVVFYLACGVGSGLLHASLARTSEIPTIGASGAIAGVLGAYFILFPRSRVLTLLPLFIFPLLVEIPALAYLGLWFALQLVAATLELTDQTGRAAGAGVAWWSHAGGFAAGVLLLLFLRPRAVARERRRRITDEERPAR